MTPCILDAGCAFLVFFLFFVQGSKRRVKLHNIAYCQLSNEPKLFSYFQKLIQFATDNLFSNLAHCVGLFISSKIIAIIYTQENFLIFVFVFARNSRSMNRH